MSTSSLNANLTYTAPLSNTPQTVAFSNVEGYIPQSVGTVAIPIGTGANSHFPVPFGSITTADVVVIYNRGNQDLGVRINGVPSSPNVLYQIPPSGILAISHPIAPGGLPIASVVLDTTVPQTGIVGQFDFYVFGAT